MEYYIQIFDIGWDEEEVGLPKDASVWVELDDSDFDVEDGVKKIDFDYLYYILRDALYDQYQGFWDGSGTIEVEDDAFEIINPYV